MMRDLDLNNPPPTEDVNTNLELGLPSIQVIQNQNTNNDVTIISRRHFEHVASTSRRNQRMFRYTDVRYERGHTAHQGNNGNSLHTLRTTQLDNNGVYRIAQWEDHLVKYEDVPEVPPPMQQRARMFNCPICMEELVEETSTKCGHVFCRRCIVEALTNERKCPICRRKLKVRDIIRIYLSNNGR